MGKLVSTPVLVLLLTATVLIAEAKVNRAWTSDWITAPSTCSQRAQDPRTCDPLDIYENRHTFLKLRRTFELKQVPSQFWVHVSADSRYELFVNGHRVNFGPAKGIPSAWHYDTLDLAPYMTNGRNTLAAWVMSWGPHLPQVGYETVGPAFVLDSDDPKIVAMVGTGKSEWKIIEDLSCKLGPQNAISDPYLYYAAPPAMTCNVTQYPWAWEQGIFDDTHWSKAVSIGHPEDREWIFAEGTGGRKDRLMTPRTLPLMELKPQRFAKARRWSPSAPDHCQNWPKTACRITIPANTKLEIILDQEIMTTAFPEVVVSGGREAKVSIGYAEAFYTQVRSRGLIIGDRDYVGNLTFIGLRDHFEDLDGGANRTLRPYWWRSWRYVQLQIQTASDPLIIEDVRSEFTALPLQLKADLQFSDPDLRRIAEIGHHTNRLIAHETYMDCPYFEQGQYIGDTLISGLVTFYNTGEFSLWKKAIRTFEATRRPDGLTLARAPSHDTQFIPGFTLIHVLLVHEYWMHIGDEEFVREMLIGTRAILNWFEKYEDEKALNGTLGPIPYWSFWDWNLEGTYHDNTALYDLFYLKALQDAAEMEAHVGAPELSEYYARKVKKLSHAIETAYWNSTRGLYANTRLHNQYNEHVQAMAVLTGVATGERAQSILRTAMKAKDTKKAGMYFRFYFHMALEKAGLGDKYLDDLTYWRRLLPLHVSTWPEIEEEEHRSECHGWSAHPNIFLPRTILGVRPKKPGFQEIIIAPHLGNLTWATGSVPLSGNQYVSVDYKLNAKEKYWDAHIKLPVKGYLYWRDQKPIALSPGDSHVRLPLA